MKVGDLVKDSRKNSQGKVPGIITKRSSGIVLETWADNDEACEVLWSNTQITISFKTNLEVISESR
jgi:hypothetical protein